MRRRHSRTSAVGTGAPENIRFVDLAPAVLNLPEQIRNALLVPRNDLLLQLHDGMLIGRDLRVQFRLIQPASVSAMRYRRRQAGISYPVRAVPAQRKTPHPAGPGHGTVLPIAAKTSKPPAAVYTAQIEAFRSDLRDSSEAASKRPPAQQIVYCGQSFAAPAFPVPLGNCPIVEDKRADSAEKWALCLLRPGIAEDEPPERNVDDANGS
jgi:hypothetical protein